MRLRLKSLLYLVLFLTGCTIQIPPIISPPIAPPAVKLTKPPRVALVLGSGGARGFAHLGVLKELERAHIPIDLIVGASAGSFIGALYADNPHASFIIPNIMRSTYADYIDLSFCKEGPITGYQFQKFILQNTHARDFKDLKIKLVTVSTDLKTGKVNTIESGPIAPAVAASCAIPSLVRPVKLYGKTLIDGGVIDPTPVDVAKQYHPIVIIAVNIAAQPNSNLPRSMVAILNQSLVASMRSLSEYSAKDADIVIRPHVGCVSTFDLSQRIIMYEAGRRAAIKMLPQIKKLLADKHVF